MMENFVKYAEQEFGEVKKRQDHTNGNVDYLLRDKIVRDTQLRMVKWGLVTVSVVLTAIVTNWVVSQTGLP